MFPLSKKASERTVLCRYRCRCRFDVIPGAYMNTLLKITGQVAQPLDLSLADFRQFGDEHQVADMSEIDPRRVGRAVSLDVLLERAQVLSTAKRLKLIGSADGYESVVPLEPLVGRGLVIYEGEG